MATMKLVRGENAAIERAEVVQLDYNETYCLPQEVLNLRVLSGTAWITAQAEDHILKAGDQMMIPRQPHAVLISAIHHQPLSFEIRTC